MVFNQIKTVGIAVNKEKLKLAALLFDQIAILTNLEDVKIPNSLIYPLERKANELEIIVDQHKNETNSILYSVFQRSLEKIRSDEEKNKILNENLNQAISIIQSINNVHDIKDKYENEVVTELMNSVRLGLIEGHQNRRNHIMHSFAQNLNSKNLSAIPLYEDLNFNSPKSFMNKREEKVEIKFINAPLINVKELTWNQIGEAKKDADFNNKLKRFSLFINKNYSGKELDFIIDDLNIQIEDYKDACSKHGISLVNSAYKSLSNSKSLFGTLGLVLCSVLFKTPEFALASGSIGAFLELANFNLEITKSKSDFNEFVNKNPFSLLFEIDKMKKAHNNG